LIETIQSSPYLENGAAAVSWAEQNGVIDTLPNRGTQEGESLPHSVAEIKRRFQRMFKKGVVYDALERNPAPLATLSRSEPRQLMAGAIQYSKNLFKRIRKGPFDVTTLCDRGRIRLIFGVPQSAPQNLRKRWKSFINRVNLSYALHSTIQGGKENDMKSMPFKPAVVWSMAVAAPMILLGVIPFKDRITGDLTLKPEERTQLYAPLAGFVREVGCREGDSVAAGDVIARFEIPDLASRISQKRAELKEVEAMYRLLQTGPRPEELAEQLARVERAERWHDKAQQELQKAIAEESEQVASKIEERNSRLEFAEEEHARARNLYDADVLSLGEYERAKRELKVTEAQKKQAMAEEQARQALLVLETESDLVQRERELAEARAALNLMEAGTRPELLEAKKAELERVREELAYLEELEKDQVLRTPIAGVVTSPDMSTKEGTFLKEGDLFCEVVDTSRLKAEIAVPDRAAARVQIGQPIDLKVRALPYRTLRAPVGQVAPVLDAGEANPTARIYCWLNNPGRELRPGMSGYARVHLGTRSLGSVLLDRMSRFVRREFWW
jgi:HlyD family secretion protein